MTLSPCRTLQNVIQTQKCVLCLEYAKPNIDVFLSALQMYLNQNLTGEVSEIRMLLIPNREVLYMKIVMA